MALDEIVTVRLAVGSAGTLWDAVAAVGRRLTGDVRVVVFRGEGPDFFDETGSMAASASHRAGPPGPGAVSWLRRPDLVTVAVIAGRATGAGLDVALACDIRVAADDAELAVPTGADPGFGLDLPTVAVLREVVGAARALEIALTGRRISGREAATIGLVSLAVPGDRLDSVVDELVAAVLRRPRAVATQAKALLAASDADHRSRTDDFVAAVQLAAGEN